MEPLSSEDQSSTHAEQREIEQRQANAQKMIHRILRLTGFAFFAGGVLTLIMGGDVILGSVLTIIGLTDIVLVPHIIEKVIAEKLKHRHQQD